MPDTTKSDAPRDAVIGVNTTEAEKQAIRIRAAMNGKSMSQYVRNVVFGREAPILDSEDIPKGDSDVSDT